MPDRGMPLAQLEEALRDLGRRLEEEAPTGAGLATAVATRLEAEADAGVQRPRGRFRDGLIVWPRRQLVLAAVLGLLLLAAAAVAVGITVGGVLLRPAETTAPAPTTPVPTTTVPTTTPPVTEPPSEPTIDLALGRRVTLSRAVGAVAFEVRVPVLGRFGGPDRVYLNQEVPGGMVSMVWDPEPGLPEIGDTGVGLVLTQFGGDVEAVKEYEPEVPPDQVSFAGETGYWVEGTHRFYFIDANGDTRLDLVRTVGSTLLWQSDDAVVLRLESALTQDAAIELAEGVVGAGN